MACYHPMDGWRSREVSKNGKRKIVFNIKDGFADMPVTVPCGKCVGCRLERARQWAVRCVHEASRYDTNCFITLTYNDENLPKDRSLVKEDFQKFMKRLRKHIQGENLPGVPENQWALFDLSKRCVRYYHCGEYGETLKRPHYHALLFNYDFTDKEYYQKKAGTVLWISDTLNRLWCKGYCVIGSVTFESAAYVARYIMKKMDGVLALEHYQDVGVNIRTGEIVQVLREYTTMSRRPGIGSSWFAEFKDEVFPSDTVIMRGREMRPPRYYDQIYDLTNHADLCRIKSMRKEHILAHPEEQTTTRLIQKEKCKHAQIKSLIRSLEHDS